MNSNRNERRVDARNSGRNKTRNKNRSSSENARTNRSISRTINTIAATAYLLISSVSIGIAGNRLAFGDRDDARGKEMAVDAALSEEREKAREKEEERFEYWRNEMGKIGEMREELYKQRAIENGRTSTLKEITQGYNEAVIDFSNAQIAEWQKRAPEEERKEERAKSSVFDTVDEKEVFVVKTSPVQAEQLKLLKTYVESVLNYKIPNYLFVFAGKGFDGVNVARQGIGLHEEMFNVSFGEALDTLIHEIVHNEKDDHDAFFIGVQGNIHTRIHEVLRNNLEYVQGGGVLDERQRIMVDAPAIWDALRKCGAASAVCKNVTQTKPSTGLEECPSADYSGGIPHAYPAKATTCAKSR